MNNPFVRYQSQPEDYWRGIILFGRNTASYKFALARTLLELKPEPDRVFRLEQLAVPFVRHVCYHLGLANKQSTSNQSRFLDACRRKNAGELSENEIVEQAVRLGFNNVIDAFI